MGVIEIYIREGEKWLVISLVNYEYKFGKKNVVKANNIFRITVLQWKLPNPVRR